MLGDDRLRPGFAFKTVEFSVARLFQECKHRAAGIDTGLYGGLADLTFLGHGAVKAIDESGISIVGQVHMTQHFRQHHAIRLDELLTVTGKVSRTVPMQRGRQVFCVFDYRNAAGNLVCEVERSALRPSAEAERKGGPGGRAPDPEEDGFEEVAIHALNPDGVAAYSDDALNPIHNDPEIAARFGFRAPIAAGLMAINFYMAALVRGGVPDRIDLSVRFLRPMFWDDRLSLQRNRGRLRLVNGEGRSTSQAVLS